MLTTTAVNKNETKASAYAWIILLVIFLASFAIPVNMFKVPPIAPSLFSTFGLDPSTFGLLMSAFNLTGIILALPASGIANKLGLKITTLAAVACCALGSLIGTFAGTIEVMLASRFVEGAGMAVFGVTAPAAIVAWFPKEKRGLALGLWSMYMPVGSILMFNLAPLMAGDGNWQAVWWFTTIYSVAATVFFALFFKMPDREPASGRASEASGAGEPDGLMPGEPEASPTSTPGSSRAAAVGLILLASMFALVVLCGNGSINTYLPTFLQTERSLSPVTAGLVTSVSAGLGIVGSPLAGFLSDRLNSRKWLIVGALVVLLVVFWFMFAFTNPIEMWVSIVLSGLASSTIAVCTMALVPEIAQKPKMINLGMGAVAFGLSVGSTLGGMALGWMLPPFGWEVGSHLLLLPLTALALVVTLFIKAR
ncbi:MAG: MFS transporter [Coriobacteriales bacterium]|jgi:MFS family permease|nr:MFS transporter [Coriobacteriales bacterium]